MYGPPGTGKTLLARAIASNIDANFLKVVASAIVDKYIGESARVIREMFGYAKDHQPCIIFMDEIDAIGGRRFSEGTSADREIQRTLMELLNQMDGFDTLGKVKIVMATNRPDVLDPALLRPGRLDRKIEIPLPNEAGRLDIIKIHASTITKHGDIDYEAVAKLAEGFNGADLRNVCTEAGMFAIRAERDYCIEEDFMKAARKVAESKKLESMFTTPLFLFCHLLRNAGLKKTVTHAYEKIVYAVGHKIIRPERGVPPVVQMQGRGIGHWSLSILVLIMVFFYSQAKL